MQGTVFLDIVLTGLGELPSAGTEVPAEGMGSCPGGVANLAIASARLGLRTALAASFGDDLYGDFLVRTLREEGIDLSLSRRIAQWHSPVTVSLAVQRDRSMITHSHPSPVPGRGADRAAPPTRAGWCISTAPCRRGRSTARKPGRAAVRRRRMGRHRAVVRRASSRSSAQLDAFLPNSAEAMAYTRTDDPRAALLRARRRRAGGGDHLRRAGRDRHRLDQRRGGVGALAAGERRWTRPAPATCSPPRSWRERVRGWPLRTRMAFANLCAALSVQQVGGSLAAPGWGDVSDWLAKVAAAGRRGLACRVGARAQLRVPRGRDPRGPSRAVRRATATIARFSDA